MCVGYLRVSVTYVEWMTTNNGGVGLRLWAAMLAALTEGLKQLFGHLPCTMLLCYMYIHGILVEILGKITSADMSRPLIS